jgi:hypothetical protein
MNHRLHRLQTTREALQAHTGETERQKPKAVGDQRKNESQVKDLDAATRWRTEKIHSDENLRPRRHRAPVRAGKNKIRGEN